MIVRLSLLCLGPEQPSEHHVTETLLLLAKIKKGCCLPTAKPCCTSDNVNLKLVCQCVSPPDAVVTPPAAFLSLTSIPCLLILLCVAPLLNTQSLVHNMAHQACFHQPLGQEWWRHAGLCLGALHPLSSCSLPFISFCHPSLLSFQSFPLFPSIIHVPQLLLNAP